MSQIKPYDYFIKIYNKNVNMCIVSNQNYDVIDKFFKYNNLKTPTIYSAPKLKISKEELITKIYNQYKNVTIYEDANYYLNFAKSIGCKAIGIEYKYNVGTLVDADEIIKT